MDRTRRLLGVSILGLFVAAAAGCGTDGSRQTPVAETRATTPVDADSATAADQVETTPADVPVETVTSDPFVNDPVVADVPPPVTEPAVTPEPVAVQTPDIVPASATGTPDNLIASAGGADVAIAAITQPREAKLLIPEKDFKKEGDALRVSYDDLDLLKVLNMEPVIASAPDMFPQWLKDLEGQRIRIRGYMRPGELAENIPFFVLARDTQACCFGPNTKAYDIIPVIMREGVTTDYIHLTPFDIVGVFHIGVEMDFANPEKVEFLYLIDDAVLISK